MEKMYQDCTLYRIYSTYPLKIICVSLILWYPSYAGFLYAYWLEVWGSPWTFGLTNKEIMQTLIDLAAFGLGFYIGYLIVEYWNS